MNWQKCLKGKVKINEPLKKHTTFKIGGAAKFYIEPKDIPGLKLLIRQAKKYKIPVFIIGAGSNILAVDHGLNALVLHLGSTAFRGLAVKGDTLKAGSGLMLKQLIMAAQNNSLSGIEFLSGIPGTVGGALAMNAGAFGRGITDLLREVKVMDYSGKVKILPKEKIKYGYRQSGLSKYIILSVSLKLTKSKKSEIRRKIEKFLRYRSNRQDYSSPSAGCIFKNPNRESAGRLIDLCGLKGKKIGGAQVSKKHANFILNKSAARSSDVLRLMRLIKTKVKERFHINLELEIQIWS